MTELISIIRKHDETGNTIEKSDYKHCEQYTEDKKNSKLNNTIQ
jgi:hypothetical protein